MSKILYCDSKGDRRFSALYAVVTLKDGSYSSIECFYQNSKRKADGSHCRKGEAVDHMVLNGKTYEAKYLTWLYEKLWSLYFAQHPDLLAYAATFDVFVDRFKGRAINCQADVIAKFVAQFKKDALIK